MKTDWHGKTVTTIYEELNSRADGLTHSEAKIRLEKYGPNMLKEATPESHISIFLRQFQSPLIYILLAASAALFVLRDNSEAFIILFVLLLNATVGTVQEGKAQNILRALKNLVETEAAVIRDGRETVVPDKEIVPGDILLLQEGNKIAADARIMLSHNLKVDEAALTGESIPVHKSEEVINKDVSTSDQKNMVFKGTNVSTGNGKAIVVATGAQSVIGSIAQKLTSLESDIPLKDSIRYLSRIIVITVACITSTLFTWGIVAGKGLQEMFGTVIGLAISIIPEGLPIVMTLVLATGVWRMSKRNALVKKLQAVEALGQAQVIAVDKTGTITKNEMVVKEVYAGGKMFTIGGIGYEPAGMVQLDGNRVNPAEYLELTCSGKISALSARAQIVFNERNKEWKISGDPTEAALQVFSKKIGFDREELERTSHLISEMPFDYKTKYHATIHEIKGKNFLALTGAPEVVLQLCKKVYSDGKEKDISSAELVRVEAMYSKLLSGGFRVIAAAMADNVGKNLEEKTTQNLTFVALFGIEDSLRLEVREATRLAHESGMRVVMITGDHGITAKSIAEQAGIFREGDEMLSGAELDGMSDEDLAKKLGKVTVFARVTPEHKLKLIQAYKHRGEIIAMTGDGVNDAMSLVAADLGVAMGKIGTDVAKEAADIVLLDDNFGSIVAAIEEGRSIYRTIKKVILYLFSTSVGEVLTITGALFLSYPLPLLPSQIIWLNLVTDGFLDVALAMEPKEENLLKKEFKKPKKYIVDALMAWRMVIMSIPMMIGTLILFKAYFDADSTKAWTISLTVLAVFQWFNAWNCKSETKSLFRTNPFSNMYLVGATMCIIILHLFAVYNPFMNNLLKTVPLGASDWGIVIAVASTIIFVEEIRKLFYRRKEANCHT